MVRLGNVMLLGDSYTTFEGHIPEGYTPYYAPKTRPEIETDVKKVEQTWWHRLIGETDSELILNCSWSGTTVCNTTFDGRDASEFSFIARLDRLIEEGYFEANRVDTLIVFGGTNDRGAHSPMGELQYGNWTREDLKQALPAFCYLLDRAKEKLPGTRVVCIINEGLQMYADGYRVACEHYGIERVDLANIEKYNGHPTVKGMEQIKDQVLQHFAKTAE
ncbi:MAG: hypothetical protein IKJ35_02025 [Clostridia bacterium]|nr:hypothetical protein [Clostridia bacterium]